MEDQTINIRLTAIEARMAAIEGRLAEQGSTTAPKRRRKELSPEDRAAIRERLVAGQEKARARREAEAKAAEKEKKEAANGAPTAKD